MIVKNKFSTYYKEAYPTVNKGIFLIILNIN